MNAHVESEADPGDSDECALAEIPGDVFEMLAAPPLLATEDGDNYYDMLAMFARSIRPDDLITWMLLKDLADHRTEIARYRRFKASLITAPRRRQVRSEISYWRNYPVEQARKRTDEATQQKALLAKSNKTPKELDKLIAEIDAKLATEIAEAEAKGRAHVEAWRNVCSSEDDYADTFSSWIGSVEKIDLLLQAAEERFSATLEEIERHVRGLGRLLREELDKIIDGEVVESQASDRKLAEEQEQCESLNGVSSLANESSPTVPAQTGIDRVARSHARSPMVSRGNR